MNDTNVQQTEYNLDELIQQSEQVSQQSVQEVPHDQEHEAEMVQQQTTQPQEESYQAKNFRALREKTSQLERERDEALRLIEEIKSQSQDEFSFNPDDLMEGKHLDKVAKRVRHLEQQLKQYEQKNTAMSAETRLRTQYPDFDKVVNENTITILKERDPELAATLNANTDLYTKASSVYKIIKQFGIYQEDSYAGDRERAQRNIAKPKPLASMAPQHSESPLSHANSFANGLTEDLRKQLFKEMNESRKNY